MEGLWRLAGRLCGAPGAAAAGGLGGLLPGTGLAPGGPLLRRTPGGAGGPWGGPLGGPWGPAAPWCLPGGPVSGAGWAGWAPIIRRTRWGLGGRGSPCDAWPPRLRLPPSFASQAPAAQRGVRCCRRRRRARRWGCPSSAAPTPWGYGRWCRRRCSPLLNDAGHVLASGTAPVRVDLLAPDPEAQRSVAVAEEARVCGAAGLWPGPPWPLTRPWGAWSGSGRPACGTPASWSGAGCCCCSRTSRRK